MLCHQSSSSERQSANADAKNLRSQNNDNNKKNNNNNWCARNNPQKIGTLAGRVGNRTMSRHHPNYSIIEIGLNTEESSGGLRRFAVAQTPVKDHLLTLVRKTRKEWWQQLGKNGRKTNSMAALNDFKQHLTRQNLDMAKKRKETESLLIAAQNNATRTNHIKSRIDKTQQNSKCRLCSDRDETNAAN